MSYDCCSYLCCGHVLLIDVYALCIGRTGGSLAQSAAIPWNNIVFWGVGGRLLSQHQQRGHTHSWPNTTLPSPVP